VIALLDVGTGNLRSVEKAFQRLGRPVARTRDPAALAAATHLVLPGVGAFGDFMDALRAAGLEAPLRARVAAGVPLLGICVGMQALYQESEEFGRHAGLGLLRGRVARFPAGALVVPHSGWNQVRAARADPLLPAGGAAEWFYFVHAYRVVEDDPATALGRCDYGGEFTAACRQGSCWGVQFHPEKSQAAGLALLGRFAALPSPAPGVAA
jgi:glutamine amidotransferase